MHRGGFDKRSRAISDWPLAAQYALAIGLVLAALLVRLPLNSILGSRVPFITVFAVLLPLVLVVRAGPFLAASFVGLAGVAIEFRGRFLGGDAAGVLELLLFALVALIATVSAWLSQRAQQRQRSADAMLRAFVDDSPTCKWITNAQGQIIYVNRAMADALGRPVEEILGRTHAQLLPPKLAELAVKHIQAVRESGQARASFEEVEPLDGTGARRVLEWRRFALKLNEDDHILVAGMANDVTEKLRVESALRDSEARYRALIETSVYGVITIDEAAIIQSANPAAEQLFGYSTSEMVGQNVAMLMPEPYKREHDSYLHNYLTTGERKIIGIGREVAGRRKDGSTFPMDLAVAEFQHGGKRHFTGTVHDISERKGSEQALHENEQRFRAIFEGVGVSVWEEDFSAVREAIAALRAQGVCDFRDYFARHPEFIQHAIGLVRLVNVNEATLKMFGASDKKQLLASLHKIFLPETSAIFVEELMTIVSGGRALEAETVLRTLDGRRIDVLFALSFPAAHERFDRVLVSLMDITQRKGAEQALRDADRNKNEFLATLGHELRNPLNAIGVALALLDAERNGPTADDARAVIGRQYADIVRLVDDLLDLGRISRGAIHLKLEPVELGPLLRDVARDNQPLCESFGHQLSIELPAQPITLHADPTRLRQMVGNLLSNACKYTPRAGKILLEAAPQDQHAVIRVVDNGVGLSTQDLGRVFDMFVQIRNDPHTAPRGLGIGLSLVKNLAALHGGTIDAASAGAGKGCTFTLRLPLAPRPAQSTLKLAASTSAPGPNS